MTKHFEPLLTKTHMWINVIKSSAKRTPFRNNKHGTVQPPHFSASGVAGLAKPVRGKARRREKEVGLRRNNYITKSVCLLYYRKNADS